MTTALLPRKQPVSAPKPTNGNVVRFGKPVKNGLRIGLYGEGGIGKTSLAANAGNNVAFFDLDESLGVLADRLPHAVVVQNINTFQDLRTALKSGGWDGIDCIVIDTCTRCERLATQDVLENIRHEKTHQLVSRIEDFGWGKGYRFIYDAMVDLLTDLDAHVRAGRNVVLVMHECKTEVQNPKGENYSSFEPRLQNNEKSNVRLLVKEWLDDLIFIGQDYEVDEKTGKAKGSGSREFQITGLPYVMAKTRTISDPYPFEYVNGSIELWQKLGVRTVE